MKKFLFALVALVLFAGAARAEDKPKLSKDDFDLGRKVDRIQDDVTELRRQVGDLTDKIDKLTRKLDVSRLAPEPDPFVVPASTQSPRPVGAGWQYNSANDTWWKYSEVQPQWAPTFSGPTSSSCPGGVCPPQTSGRRFRW